MFNNHCAGAKTAWRSASASLSKRFLEVTWGIPSRHGNEWLDDLGLPWLRTPPYRPSLSFRLISSTPYAWLHWLPKLDCYLGQQLTAGSFSGPAWSSMGTSPSWPNPILSKKGIQNNSGTLELLTSIFPQLLQHINFTNTLHEVFLGNFGLEECPKLAVASNWLKIILKGKLDISWQETWLLKYTKPQKDSEKVQSTIISGIGFYQNRPLWWFWSSPSIFTFQRQTAANSCQIMAGSTARRSVALPFCPNCCPRRDNKETKGKGSNKVMGEWNTLFWRM